MSNARGSKRGSKVPPAGQKRNTYDGLANDNKDSNASRIDAATNEISNCSTIEELQKFFKDKVQQMEQQFDDKLQRLEERNEAKVDTLHRVINEKDTVIGRLNNEIGELKKSLDFLTNETSEIKKSVAENVKNLDSKISISQNNVSAIKYKTVDLEDRSRRCNLVFYGFEEAPNENCEKLILELLQSLRILEDEEIWIERAHRLGKRNPANERPRPIIVCFTYFKQKQEIIRNGNRFKHCNINVSEDYSKETLEEHKKLRSLGIQAKQNYRDDTKAIKHYKVAYKRLVLTYSTNKQNQSAPTFVKTFTIQDIASDPDNWFIPVPANSTARTPVRSPARTPAHTPTRGNA